MHTPPYQPEGRGKIERFFRSVRERFLASLDPKAVYHRREHGALQTTPLLRWQRDIDRIRQLPPATDLRRLFFHRVDRLVRRDSTFLLHNRFFEAPPHLAGQRIEVRFDPLDPERVEIYHASHSTKTSLPAPRSTCCARSPWRWICSRRTFAATWCGRLPTPSCGSTRARSSIPSSAGKSVIRYTGSLHGELLSIHKISQAYPGIPTVRQRLGC